MEFQNLPLWRLILILAFCALILAGAIAMPIGFVCQGVGKREIGSKFIKYGAVCGATGFSLALLAVPGFFWQAVVIVLAIQIAVRLVRRLSKRNIEKE